jgi:hypothetical protein
LETTRRVCAKRHGVRSVYIRGSIPRGLAIENISDADLIYFSEFNFDAAGCDLEKAAAADFPFTEGLELFRLDRARFERRHHPKQRPYFHMLLKTQSLKQGVERSMRQWFSRRIVRSGFEVTMDRSDGFSRDLYLCHEHYSKFYPERSEQMHRVLNNCLNGEDDLAQYEELVTFLAQESPRLLAL